MNKHLVIFSPIVQWPVHFETDLEIAQLHLDKGWEVTFLICRGALPTCAQNIHHRTSVCRKCVSRFDKGIRWLGKGRVTVREFQTLTVEERQAVASINASSFRNLAEVRKFKVDDAAIGLAVVGAIISFLREPKPEVGPNHHLFTVHLQSTLLTYYSIRNSLLSLRPDSLVIFNGRFAEMRAALYAGQAVGIPTFVHERAGVLDRYSLLSNTSPHDVAAMKKIIASTYEDSPLNETEKNRIANEWYEERRNNQAQCWYSYTTDQKQGLLPDFDLNRINLVIFNSSEDEMVSFDDWQSSFYEDQNEGIRKIVSDLCANNRFKVFLRIHPHLKTVDNSQTRSLKKLEEDLPELNVIRADSPVSTYSILDTCDLVLVFGSTVGIEAAYSGRPTFLMGRSYYEDLGCCVRPESHDDLIRLLSQFASGSRDMLPAKETVNRAVAVYGYFNKAWGETYRYVKPCHIGKSVLVRNGKETVLRPSIYSWLLDKIVSLITR